MNEPFVSPRILSASCGAILSVVLWTWMFAGMRTTPVGIAVLIVQGLIFAAAVAAIGISMRTQADRRRREDARRLGGR